MSGHSKWAGIKHKKALVDAKRGKLFTKLIRELTIAARQGGGNPDNNPALRRAIESAKEANMPQDNIKKAIQRGTGELPGLTYEEIIYEGYGPGGIAVVVKATTDNKNRTTNEIRKIFAQFGGSLGESGCVAWMFDQKGYVTVEKSKIAEDELMSIALDLGVEDFISDDEDVYEIITAPKDFYYIVDELKKKEILLSQSEITLLPKTYIKLTGKEAEQMLNLMNSLEEHEDVSSVAANFDIPKEVMEKVAV
ncbi:MAG: YebC/PmpR family DNA-binding transcriptional regulator [Elusimicrobiota bacterium]|nr:YebC/PmpR family DNA-binding transcriptional regulator [Elusimicrobiota bacterium]